MVMEFTKLKLIVFRNKKKINTYSIGYTTHVNSKRQEIVRTTIFCTPINYSSMKIIVLIAINVISGILSFDLYR